MSQVSLPGALGSNSGSEAGRRRLQAGQMEHRIEGTYSRGYIGVIKGYIGAI